MSHHASRRFYDGPTFDVETYREVITASYDDLETNWQKIADELLGRLVHALGTASQYDLTNMT